MRILVCGGRDFDDYAKVCEVLNKYSNITEICHGGARGADSLANDYANHNKIPCKVYNADWNKHGKSAGIIRNFYMLHDFKPDLVVSFKGGRGTQNMIDLSLKNGYVVDQQI